jgi:hypothetical protein
LPVINGVVSAKSASDILLVLRASSRNDGRSEGFGDLNGSKADTTSCSVDKYPVTCIR